MIDRLIEVCPMPAALVGAGRVVVANAAWRGLFGDATGTAIADLLIDPDPSGRRDGDGIRIARWRLADGRARAFETRLAPEAEGREVVFLAPLAGDAGADRSMAIRAATPAGEITEETSEPVAVLKRRIRRLENIIAGTDAGTWEIDLATRELRVDERWAGICGYTLAELSPLGDETWMRLCHPDDLVEAHARLAAYLRGETDLFEQDLRMRHRDGGWVWVLARGRLASRTAEGEPEWLTGIHLDITDRKRAEQALVEARAGAEAANLAKSRFLASASHEIRTPLNAMTGVAGALAERLTDSEDRRLADIVVEAGEAMVQILDDVLDLSKIEAGRLDLETVPLDPTAIACKLEARYDVLARRKGVALVVETTPAAAQERLGDPMRLTQVLDNLLSNAVKFTESGTVSLRLDAGAAGLAIEVSDTGIGIAPEVQCRLFGEFAQGEASTARRFGGSGLGLSIVGRLVDLMQGVIVLDSTPGQGTSVRVTLPLPRVEPAACSVASPGGVPPGLRLLVADDGATNRLLMTLLLERFGAESVVVDGGRAALDAYRPGAFDAVLIDLCMPDLDGFAVLEGLRRAEVEAAHPPTPMIAVTANAMADQVAECLAAGFDRHLAKPVVLEGLRATLADVLGARPPPHPMAACRTIATA